jgi:hypothetical protein
MAALFLPEEERRCGRIQGSWGAYLNLHDGMKAECLNVPLTPSTRDWYKKWFYVQQEQEPFVAWDITQIPEQQESWSTRPSSAEMV